VHTYQRVCDEWSSWARVMQWSVAVVVVSLSIAAGFATESWKIGFGLAMVLAAHLCVSAIAGAGLRSNQDVVHSELRRKAWLLRLWLLHVPWGVHILLTPLMFLAAFFDRAADASRLAWTTLTFMLFPGWILGCLVIAVVWSAKPDAGSTPMAVEPSALRRSHMYARALIFIAISFLIGGWMWYHLIRASWGVAG
jgi:hypothetical protein